MTSDLMVRELEGLRALARSLAHGDAEADDLIQDTAAAALAHPPALDRPVRPWLATVLRNRWRMGRRSAIRRQVREHIANERIASGEPVDDPIDRARMLQRLSAALVALDEPFRSTIIRRYLDGESAAEIARATGVPPPTVRWRLRTGLLRLRNALANGGHPERLIVVPVPLLGGMAVKSKVVWLALIVLLLLLGIGVMVARRTDSAPSTASEAPAGNGRRAELPGSALGVDPGRPATAATAEPAAPASTSPRVRIRRVAASGGILSGQVISWSTGEPVSGAELTFGASGGATTVRADRFGRFSLSPNSPGRFELTTATAPGFLPYAPELGYSPIAVTLVADTEVAGLTIFLSPALEYHGIVVDRAGHVVAGAKVRALGAPAGEQMLDKLITDWVTDSKGSFTFHAPDNTVFEAVLGKRRGWGVLDGKAQLTHQLTIAIDDAPPRDATISGIVRDDHGPVADAQVRADPQGDSPSARATVFALSGPDGSFVLAGVDRSAYVVTAAHGDHVAAVHEDVIGGTAGIRLTLTSGVPLTGTCVSTTGEPVPAFSLIVERRNGAARERIGTPSIIDPSGKFRFMVAPGDYELIASASGLAPSAPTVATAGGGAARLVLSVGATLRGRVVSASNGAPLRYARVTREARGGGPSAGPSNPGTVTRADGSFELAGVPAGPVVVVAVAGGFHPKIEAGMTATDGGLIGPIDIALAPLAEGEQPQLELVGIGVGLQPKGDALEVTNVVKNGGAESAGIVTGDLVVAVDGATVAVLGLEGAVAKIRGVAGTTVAITIRRGDQTLPLVVERRRFKA